MTKKVYLFTLVVSIVLAAAGLYYISTDIAVKQQMQPTRYNPLDMSRPQASPFPTAFADGIRVDDMASIPDTFWVQVKNPEGVSNGNGEFDFNGDCVVKQGGTVRVRALDGTRLLVEYSAPGQQYGTACPSGTIFGTHLRTFTRMTSDYNRAIKAKASEREKMRELLRQ